MAETQSGFSAAAPSLPEKLYTNRELFCSLTATIAMGRLSHAYLFYGPKGVGKKTFASYFAAAILCKGREAEKPCRECHSCKKAFSRSHPDIFLYEGKRGSNAFHIETVRELRQDAYILPNESDYKIYVLPNVEDMSQGAANAFLKILEEPPAHVIFLLTADNPELVMETIRSRCIRQELYPLPEKETADALSEMFPDRPEGDCQLAAALSNGILGQAVDILENTDYTEISDWTRRLTKGLVFGNEYEILAVLAYAGQSKEKMQALLAQFSHTLRKALRCKFNGQSSPKELSGKLTAMQIESSFYAVEQARAAIGGNANLGLLANYLASNLMHAIGLG